MRNFVINASAFVQVKAWNVREGLIRRRSVLGVQVTTESLGWIVGSVFFVGLMVLWATGPGKTWMNGIFGGATNIQVQSISG